MKYPTKIKDAIQILQVVFVLSVVVLCSPVPHALAQFNGGGSAVPNWLNQALPSALGAQPNYSTTGISTLNPPSVFTSSNVGMQNWQIGIFVKRDTEWGTSVDSVQNNSPAARAGIKKDDLIITVNGQQVGLTPKGAVDIGVLTNQIATNGKIVALIADGVTGKLKNVTIDLAQTTTNIEGQVRLPISGLLTSYLSVTLKNVTRPQYEVVGGKTSGPISNGGSFKFVLQVDPSSIVPTDRYQLEARVDDARNTIQYYSLADVDINRLLAGNQTYLTLDLEPYQQWLARNTNNGQVVQAGYTGGNVRTDVTNWFQTIIGRTPNAAEINGWSNFLLEGNSLDEMKIRLISHQSFYDSVGDDPTQFVISMIRILSGRLPNSNEVNQWTARLAQMPGYREAVVREYLKGNGNGGQLR